MPSYKLTYFPIEGAAEKLRLAFVMAGVEFEDNRMAFPQWQELKPKTKFGQLPMLEVDGKEMTQSAALLRWIASKGDGSLYPSDPDERYKVDEMVGMCDDLARDWGPSLYMGMRPTKFGYPEDMAKEAQMEIVKALREKFIAEDLPRYAKYIENAVAAGGGGFLCGDKPTIADLNLLPQLRYYTKGVADFVPKECLDPYPAITSYIERMMNVPQIKDWYATH